MCIKVGSAPCLYSRALAFRHTIIDNAFLLDRHYSGCPLEQLQPLLLLPRTSTAPDLTPTLPRHTLLSSGTQLQSSMASTFTTCPSKPVMVPSRSAAMLRVSAQYVIKTAVFV